MNRNEFLREEAEKTSELADLRPAGLRANAR
jgi:hypothetical protein